MLNHRVKRLRSGALVAATLVLMIYFTFHNEEYAMNQLLDEEELPRITTELQESAGKVPLSRAELERLELSTEDGLKEKNKYFPLLGPENANTKGNQRIPDEYFAKQNNVKLRDFKKEQFYKVGTENYYKFPKITKPTNYPEVQSSYFTDGGLKNKTRLDRIIKVFDKSWSTYSSYAYGHDEVRPLKRIPEDSFNGWAATLIDSLDTLWLMGKKQEFQKAVKHIKTINFKQTFRSDIPLFENVIRVLGGLISGYELSQEESLLESAKNLAELLMEAFDTPNNMPMLYYQWKSEIQNRFASTDACLAEVGSLSLEFSRLTQLTKNSKYFDAITRITKIFDESFDNGFLLPGLYTNRLDISGCMILSDEDIEHGVHLNNPKVIKSINGDHFVYCLRTEKMRPVGTQQYSIGGQADSFYEYMPKMYHLLRGGDSKHSKIYKDMYLSALKHIKEFMLFKPKILDNDDILFVSSVIAHKLPETESISVEQSLEMQHLSCFAGGMFALASRLFDLPNDMDIAGNVTMGCVEMYKRMKIMPEILWVDKSISKDDVFDEKARMELIRPNPAATAGPVSSIQKRSIGVESPRETKPLIEWTKTFLESKPQPIFPRQKVTDQGDIIWPVGSTTNQPIWVNRMDPKYLLRPEAIESVFYMYRITGDSKWRDCGWIMWKNIEELCRNSEGEFSALSDVTFLGNDSNFIDSVESFWYSETLKYFYLLFEDISVWSLDEYVYNTEAHPFKLEDN